MNVTRNRVLLGTVAAGIVASGLFTGPTAHATYAGKTGTNGKIVYVAPGKNNNFDIYSIHKDGTHR